ncbi:MAG: alginate export family protein [Myxococcota bacterium]
MKTQWMHRKSFRLVLALPLATALLLGGATAGAAEEADSSTPDVAAADWHQVTPTLKLGGSLRLRAEEQSNYLFGSNAPSDDESYTLHRLRLNMTWTPTESLTFFVEGQDAEIHSENDINDEAIPNLFANHFDLHQGYMDYRSSLSGTPYMLRIGRQKLDFGDERLVSSLEWENVARVFDGVRLNLGVEDDWTLDLFWTRAVAVRPGNFDDWEKTGSRYVDSDFHGAYYSNWKMLSNTKWDLYLFLRDQDESNDRVFTLGTGTESVWGRWDADFDFAYQWGDFGRVDHSAWMLHFGFGYRPEWMEDSRIGLAYNWATGDDNNLDTDHDTFDSLYPTTHNYGITNLVGLQNMRTLELSWDMKMMEKGKLRVAIHKFWIDEPEDDAMYNANLAVLRSAAVNADSEAGSEVDITFSYPFWNDRVVATVGYGHYFAGDFINDTAVDDDDADFLFLQADLKF